MWADQLARLTRLRAACDVAALTPAQVEEAGAAAWTERQLAQPAPGRATVVLHSIVMQYLSDGERGRFEACLQAAGERAGAAAPLAWLRMEPAGERAEVRLTVWPGGEERLLARAGFHGDPVEWLAASTRATNADFASE